MKKVTVLLIFIMVLLVAASWFAVREVNRVAVDNPALVVSRDDGSAIQTVDMCFLYNKETERGFYDKSWLSMNLEKGKVDGEFHYVPAERDSKTGKFSGSVSDLIPEIMGRKVEAIWQAEAEGETVEEDLLIEFGEGTAVALFGEMVLGPDGVYVYKDRSIVTPGPVLSQIACERLEEIQVVEKYVQENIAKIATDSPVLGGSWYVLGVSINPSTKTGEVVYEDGHIQSRGIFEYLYNDLYQDVGIKTFELIK